MSDELLDLVDCNDTIIGCAPRSKVYAEKKNNFRAMNLFIENSAGNLWIPRRSAEKRAYPSKYQMWRKL